MRDSLLGLEVASLRDHAINPRAQVDDTPYGGGSGMLLRPEPVVSAVEEFRTRHKKSLVVLLTPKGKPLTQKFAGELRAELCDKSCLLICPRYEGIDERTNNWVDLELSLGDFVLMGGEVAAMAFIEVMCRFIPGLMGNSDSLREESFEGNMLEYPQYTKPRSYRGLEVPSILLSGNHEEIDKWRRDKALEETLKRRPDLLESSSTAPAARLSLALIHHPVVDKHGLCVTSSLTNLDLHDIARSAKTYGLENFYVVHPTRAMRKLALKILGHWSSGFGSRYNPNRKTALELVKVLPDFDDVIFDIEERYGQFPVIVATSAKNDASELSFGKLKSLLSCDRRHYLILLGTGWGLADEILNRAQLQLEAIKGAGDYRHLSVRAAAAIILDRLCSR